MSSLVSGVSGKRLEGAPAHTRTGANLSQWATLERNGNDTHRSRIAQLRDLLSDELVAADSCFGYHDDAWLLRYALSFREDLSGAVAAAQRAVAWRLDNTSLVESARERCAPPGLTDRELQLLNALFVTRYNRASVRGDPIYIIRVQV